MAMIQVNDSGFVVKPYKYERYPLVMHKGQHPNIQSIQVKSEAEEQDAAAKGFSLNRPAVPDPAPERPTLTVEERLAELEDQVAELQAILSGNAPLPEDDQDIADEDLPHAEVAVRRGRGRPRKET
jgi:hypothetical protein